MHIIQHIRQHDKYKKCYVRKLATRKVYENLPATEDEDWLGAAVVSAVFADGLSGMQYSSLSGFIARQLPSSMN